MRPPTGNARSWEEQETQFCKGHLLAEDFAITTRD